MADAAQDLDSKDGALSTAKDLFAGAVGGVAQVLIGRRQSLLSPNLIAMMIYGNMAMSSGEVEGLCVTMI